MTVLPHSSATVERIFSQTNRIKTNAAIARYKLGCASTKIIRTRRVTSIHDITRRVQVSTTSKYEHKKVKYEHKEQKKVTTSADILISKV